MDSPIAVYNQVKNVVQFAIASGELEPGTPLPSVRTLSNDLDINPNTVTKAYRDLELMGLVSTRRGVGVTITDKASKLCREAIRAHAMNHLRESVAECVASGLSAKEVRQTVKEAIDAKLPPYMPNGK